MKHTRDIVRWWVAAAVILWTAGCVQLTPLHDVVAGDAASTDATDATDASDTAAGADTGDVSEDAPETSPAVTALAAGSTFALALFDDGTVVGWGYPEHGVLLGSKSTQTTPRVLAGLQPAKAIAAGADHACLLDLDGTVWCWGRNNWGQVGILGASDVDEPQAVYPGAKAVYAGMDHTCAVTNLGALVCWGRALDYDAQLEKPYPTPIDFGLVQVSDAHIGAGWACALTSDDGLWCWGDNARGAVGVGVDLDGDDDPWEPSPRQVDLDGVVSVGGGVHHVCAVTADSKVWCWGFNDYGQAGVASNDIQVDLPRTILFGFDSPTATPGGTRHGCVLDGDGAVLCGGDNSAQLSSAPKPIVSTPSQQLQAPKLRLLTSGHQFVCGVASQDDAVWCWGANLYEQLGTGEASFLEPPTTLTMPTW